MSSSSSEESSQDGNLFNLDDTEVKNICNCCNFTIDAKIYINYNSILDNLNEYFIRKLLFSYIPLLNGYLISFKIITFSDIAEIFHTGEVLVKVECEGLIIPIKEGDQIEIENGKYLGFIECLDENNTEINTDEYYTVIRLEDKLKIFVN